MYKDKDRQREANRTAQARFKAKAKGITIESITDRVLPADVPSHGLDVAFEKTEFIKPRRGKDITKFEHLPPDVQATIDRMSDDEQEHSRRTAIAINYQHQFPAKYRSTGLV